MAIPTGEVVSVGGRLVRSGSELRLTDAIGSVALDLDLAFDRQEAEPPAEGTLLVVEGRYQSARLSGKIRETHPGGSSTEETSRFRDRGVGQALLARQRILSHLREYFARHRFLEVETPLAVPSPGLDLHLDAYRVESAGPERYLITSPEYQMKRLLSGGVPRCFQFAKCFRRSEIGQNHNPEFTMLEWYRAFGGMDEMIGDTESIVRGAFEAAAGLEAPGRAKDAPLDLATPFRRFTVAEAFAAFADTDEEEMLRLANDDEETFFRLLVDRVEPAMEKLHRPVVLHRFPAKMASLARLDPEDPRYAERFEVYARGIELSNGFVELCDQREQRARLERDSKERKEKGLPVYPIDERFLAALEEGMPPAVGNALGFDRLVMLATGASKISQVVAFPEGVL